MGVKLSAVSYQLSAIRVFNTANIVILENTEYLSSILDSEKFNSVLTKILLGWHSTGLAFQFLSG
ncbi:hypothetical protein A6D95_12360 [Vibrio breoganii]|nr:hypothetical protein A6D95_12360 [Vibrio breoganii]